MLVDDRAPSIAVFIDAENLLIELWKAGVRLRLKPIIDRIREEGRIASIKAYGDWSRQPLIGFVQEFRTNIIEMVQLSTSAEGKNTGDIQLALDALEMAVQPASPSVFVIVSGDRDFVPLVQKLKRYGKFVMGIGHCETSTSKLLADACDLFIFADEILEKTFAAPGMQVAPTTDEATVVGEVKLSSKLRKAFALLAKAVASCGRDGLPASDSLVQVRMRQLDSTFYPGRYGFVTFHEFAQAAEAAGYARILHRSGAEGLVFDATYQVDPELVREDLVDYDYSTVESALESYKDILRTYKKLELLPWSDRKTLVAHAWDYLSDSPKTYDDLVAELQLYAAANMSWVSEKAIELLVRTLSIARCFVSDDGCPHFFNTKCHVKPAVTLDEALHLMNYTYLNGIKLAVPNVEFVVDAVAILLFDEATDETRREAQKLIAELGVSLEPEETAMSLALKKAGVTNEDAAEQPSAEATEPDTQPDSG
ncbi:MAG: NYN domain-containing protein [Armatimonadota bacterium]|nr:NYN domain-containing protein [Armatimonadota bacterium]